MRFRSPLVAAIVLVTAMPAIAQSGRQVKVVLEFQQQSQAARQGAQGQGSIIIEDGKKPRGRGGLGVEDTTTRTTRTSGVFTVVQDGARRA